MLTDNASWLSGKHFLQAGGTLLWGGTGNTAIAVPPPRALSTSTAPPPGTDCRLPAGQCGYVRPSSTQIRKHIDYPLDTFYVQDRWQVARRLTLSLGLRFFYMPKPHEQVGGEVVFDPALLQSGQCSHRRCRRRITLTPTYDPANGPIYNGVNGVPLNLTNAHNYYSRRSSASPGIRSATARRRCAAATASTTPSRPRTAIAP